MRKLRRKFQIFKRQCNLPKKIFVFIGERGGVSLEDSKIIELYFARDEAAITETSAKYGYYCKKIAMNILADLFESEECVNDTYVKVWNTVPPTVPNIFKAFLAKITRNLALDRYNEKTAKKRGGRVYESLEELSECIGSNETEQELDRGALTELINGCAVGRP